MVLRVSKSSRREREALTGAGEAGLEGKGWENRIKVKAGDGGPGAEAH